MTLVAVIYIQRLKATILYSSIILIFQYRNRNQMGVCNSIAEVAPGAVAKRSRGQVKGDVYVPNILEALNNLPQGNNVIAEYVWIDGQAMQKSELRSEGVRSK